MLRVYIDEDLKMKYAFAAASALPATYEDAEKLSQSGNSQVKVIGAGNIETFRAVLNYQHLDFDNIGVGSMSSPAVYVPHSAPASP